MCDRHGNLGLRNLATAALDRRSFLKASALGTITMAVGGGMMGLPGSARAATTIKGTHGNGFCNVAFFITHARQLAKEDGLTLEFVNTPSFADQVTFLGTGQVDVSVLPYTNFMALYDAGAPVKIVARRRRPGRIHRRPAGPRYAGQAQGQDARNLPERHARSAAIRLAEEERRLLQGRHRPLHGLDGRHGGRVQGRRDRHRLDHRALRLGAPQRRERFDSAVRRRRHLRRRNTPIACSPRARNCWRRTPRASRR